MIGKRLLDLREDADLTQEQLSKILNINKHSISSYERNKSEPPDIIKIKIAKYFNISSDYLLDLTDIKTPVNELMIDNLKPDEADLIRKFRAMSVNDKNKVLGFFEAIVG